MKIEYKSGLEYIKSEIQLQAKSKIEWRLSENDWDSLNKNQDQLIVNLIGPRCSNNCWAVDIEKETISYNEAQINPQSLLPYPSRTDRRLFRSNYWIKTRLKQWPQHIGHLNIWSQIVLYYTSGKTGTMRWAERICKSCIQEN